MRMQHKQTAKMIQKITETEEKTKQMERKYRRERGNRQGDESRG